MAVVGCIWLRDASASVGDRTGVNAVLLLRSNMSTRLEPVRAKVR